MKLAREGQDLITRSDDDYNAEVNKWQSAEQEDENRTNFAKPGDSEVSKWRRSEQVRWPGNETRLGTREEAPRFSDPGGAEPLRKFVFPFVKQRPVDGAGSEVGHVLILLE